MKTAPVLLVALTLVASPAHAQIGSLLKGAQRVQQLRDIQMSAEEERQLGELVSTRVREKYGVVQDADVHRYVTLVGAVLTARSSRPDLAWQVIVLDTDAVNAFATPGGYVHVTRGALALMKNEAELAGVLGHEIAHVAEKHTIKAIQKSKAVQMGANETLAGNTALLQRLADKTFELVLAGFGRAEELEADRVGVGLASGAGYAPGGLSTFLRSLTERNKDATEKRGLFASHPQMTERLQEIDKRIEAEKLSGGAVLEERFRKFISYTPTPQSQIAVVEAGSAGLAGGGGGSSPPPANSEGAAAGGSAPAEDSKAEEPKKKRGFGLGGLLRPGREEKKSAQVVGSGGARGVDPEVDARGGSNPAVVAVTLTPADIEAFKKEGNLK
jgi:Zn-dependent protease with chaperone function